MKRRAITIRDGFSLIELLVVVSVIGILAAIAVPNFLNAKVRAEVTRVIAELQSCATAMEGYFVDSGSYPFYWNGLDEVSALGGAAVTYLPVTLTTPVAYMSALPNDPFPLQVMEGSGADERLKPYKYIHGYDQVYRSQQFIGSHIRIHLMNYSGGNSAVLWQVWSMGPDRIPAHDGLRYDISNGLFSNGDISRFGP